MPHHASSGLCATRIVVLMTGVACCGAFQPSAFFGSAPPALVADPAAHRPRPPPLAPTPSMHLRETYELSRGMRQGSIKGRPSAGWGVLRDTPGPGRRRPRLQRDMSTGALPGSKKNEFILYRERWLMLAIVSALALLSDWACFAAVGGTKTWVNAFHKSPEDLIDIFLFSNVLTCFMYTDLTRRFGASTRTRMHACMHAHAVTHPRALSLRSSCHA